MLQAMSLFNQLLQHFPSLEFAALVKKHGAEVRTNYVRRIYQWKQALAFSSDECRGATSLHRTQNVPAMRS